MEQWNKEERITALAWGLTRSVFRSGPFRVEQSHADTEPAGFSMAPPYPAPITRSTMVKRSVTPSDLIERSIPWLAWWQELILNWVASWHTIGLLVVTSHDGDDQATWDMPTDLALARLELEELLDAEHEAR